MDPYVLDKTHWKNYRIIRACDNHCVQEFPRGNIGDGTAAAIVGLMNSAYRAGQHEIRSKTILALQEIM